MCIRIKTGALIATKNIVVFKAGTLGKADDGTNIFGVPTGDFQYIQDIKEEEVKLVIEQGFGHQEIEEGYHSANYPWSLLSHREHWDGYEDSGVFIIPKGATYYEGVWGFNGKTKNRVSNTIMYIGPFWSIKTWIKVLKYKGLIKE